MYSFMIFIDKCLYGEWFWGDLENLAIKFERRSVVLENLDEADLVTKAVHIEIESEFHNQPWNFGLS